jgi:hypothetical protein
MARTSESDDLLSLIDGLGVPDPATRERAAAGLFRRGRKLGRAAAGRWLADSEFAKHFTLDETQFPRTTVGVAVKPESFERIRAANGSPRLVDVPPDQDAKEFELNFPKDVRLDILTTRDPAGTGAIARYLAKFGEGIQQIELETHDVDGATEALRSHFSVAPIYPATRPGADGTRVNFFLAALPDGMKVLIELVEVPALRR